jgi:hypothetical protein
MTHVPQSSPRLSEAELQILRKHWEWSNRYIVLSLVLCFAIMGGAFAIFEYTGMDERARTPALILLATMILINVIWRAVSTTVGRIELILLERDGGAGLLGRRS